MRVFELPSSASARARGRAHGEEFRGEIAGLAALRLELTRTVGGFSSSAAVLEVARAHLPVLQSFDGETGDELLGIAEGAGLPPEAIVVLNHYTDLRDLGATVAPPADGCSMVWARTSEGVIAAQTWDMHASAMPHVILLRVPPVDDGPGAWVLSLVGCLGMAGVNDARVTVMINNLTSTDAVVGVVWSAVVRRALREGNAAAAHETLRGARFGSGHHYLIADARSVFALETSGTRQATSFTGDASHYIHTNHCLCPDIEAHSTVSATSTTFDRYRALEASLAAKPVAGLDDAWSRLGDAAGYPRSVSTVQATFDRPHAPATCGALAVNLDSGRMIACAGPSHRAVGHRWVVGEGT